MKNKNLKTLSLNKNVISNLKETETRRIKGGEFRESSNDIFLCEAQCFSVPCL
ncbi:class I lanthipeptide [uncultured Lacinutrix sp.]|uniref:class I lanthipeptide n=1 Tax=uncultured Lacinutrix sp. TaxID=574032 RepID=UPI00260902AE|nr:class I lanthipeptide [uncultured Lacinutrix sp.]